MSLPLHPARTPPASDRELVRFQRSRRLSLVDVPELWRFRELLAILVWRDIKTRYKQTLLGGVVWALGRPLGTMVIFSVVFGTIAGIKSGNGTPYPLFVLTGLLPWTYFSTCLGSTSNSIIGNSNLVTKTYFPRILLPLVATVSPLVDFALSLAVLAGMFGWYGIVPSNHAPFVLCFLALALLNAFGFGLWLASFTVRYRDVPMAIPFIIQLWMYLTPVIYPVTLVPAAWRRVLVLNPMAGVIDGFRWSLIGGAAPSARTLIASAVVGSVVTVTGLFYFSARERRFADVI